jgi:hypothetical protein
VQRIWSDLGLAPHRVETFKVSTDPKFDDKLIDVVGLYLDPPEKAIVLCMDEKSQIQALDRTQASLPIVTGRAGTMTHDYKRNGTTTLFAALDVLTGTVIGQCLPRHRHDEFITFLNTIDREVPKGPQVARKPVPRPDRQKLTPRNLRRRSGSDRQHRGIPRCPQRRSQALQQQVFGTLVRQWTVLMELLGAALGLPSAEHTCRAPGSCSVAKILQS